MANASIIRDCPVGIAVSVVEGAGTTLMSGNVIGGATDGAILGYRWNDRATDELIDGAAGHHTWRSKATGAAEARGGAEAGSEAATASIAV